MLASLFGLVIVGGTAAAVSRFVSRSERPKAYECKVTLRDVLWAQRDFRDARGRFAATFAELGFKLGKPGRYTYFLGDTLGPADVTLPSLARAPGATTGHFLAACAANLDPDPEVDVWVISSDEGEPTHVLSD